MDNKIIILRGIILILATIIIAGTIRILNNGQNPLAEIGKTKSTVYI
ncbi:hypothetical protein ALNOE001_16240 [Candidatus Methanobinarius endosymbioticus]|uniref:Uncharacterized protein n=1 Tax=Candidatus Methanobinarius endosymbioticus TaxID=2006182 RepID=A0A366M9E3_9EURY|nr:hypothetical protein ALNOE001_16240 [Candidatus Methanobinarius endosymbioticus]